MPEQQQETVSSGAEGESSAGVSQHAINEAALPYKRQALLSPAERELLEEQACAALKEKEESVVRLFTRLSFTKLNDLLELATLLEELGVPEKARALYDLVKNNPPRPEKKPEELSVGGEVRIDSYTWLHDLTTEGAKEHLAEENAHSKGHFRDVADLQSELYTEMVYRIPDEEETMPKRQGQYYYSELWQRGDNYQKVQRRRGSPKAEPEVILDFEKLAAGKDYFSVSEAPLYDLSRDHQLLAVAIDTKGREHYSIFVKDLSSGEKTGEGLREELRETTGNFTLSPCGKELFYSVPNHRERAYKVYRHVLGTPQKEDILVFHEPNEAHAVWLSKSTSGKYLFIETGTHVSNETRAVDLTGPKKDAVLLCPLEEGVQYWAAHHGDSFVFLTNRDGAKNFTLMMAPVGSKSSAEWRELIPYNANLYIKEFDVVRDHVIFSGSENARNWVRVFHIPSGTLEEVPSPGGDTPEVFYFDEPAEFDTDVICLDRSSLIHPTMSYTFSLRTKALEEYHHDRVERYNPEHFRTERLWAEAKDGALVPVTLAYPKDAQGPIPYVLVGYGAYGDGYPPSFDEYPSDAAAMRLSLLERGIGFALVHVRGGDELGREWWEQGKLHHKENTFDDFIAAAEHLVAKGYAQKDALGALGRSAGGALIGAVVNRRPDLFQAAIAGVPFVDAITTMADEAMPLVEIEYEEWGNPKVPTEYRSLLQWSPYDNVKAQEYPALFIYTGLEDPRVDAREPVKWAAKLREHQTGTKPILLKTDMGPGHSGSSGRLNKYRETAQQVAFFLKHLL